MLTGHYEFKGQTCSVPTRVHKGLADKKCLQIACGSSHTMFLADTVSIQRCPIVSRSGLVYAPRVVSMWQVWGTPDSSDWAAERPFPQTQLSFPSSMKIIQLCKSLLGLHTTVSSTLNRIRKESSLLHQCSFPTSFYYKMWQSVHVWSRLHRTVRSWRNQEYTKGILE